MRLKIQFRKAKLQGNIALIPSLGIEYSDNGFQWSKGFAIKFGFAKWVIGWRFYFKSEV